MIGKNPEWLGNEIYLVERSRIFWVFIQGSMQNDEAKRIIEIFKLKGINYDDSEKMGI